MAELLAQFVTPQMQSFFLAFKIMIAMIYVLIVVWVARDAYQRGTLWWAWALVALVPFVGIIAYLLLRPSLLQIDRAEQELEIALKQREIVKYGECAKCGYPVEADYVICPNCHQRLKNLCSNCGHALDPSWTVCPYCTHPVGGKARRPIPPQQPVAQVGSQRKPAQTPPVSHKEQGRQHSEAR